MINYFDQYCGKLMAAVGTVDVEKLDKAKSLITKYMQDGNPILTMGNGGSAAIADHAPADLMKLVAVSCVKLKPWVISLVSNAPTLTAIANDYFYNTVFDSQIEWCGSQRALVIGISSSGNSKNIIDGFYKAKEKGYRSIALVGFNGGDVLGANLADVIIHVDSTNYGIVEDCHQIILHSIMQAIILNNNE